MWYSQREKNDSKAVKQLHGPIWGLKGPQEDASCKREVKQTPVQKWHRCATCTCWDGWGSTAAKPFSPGKAFDSRRLPNLLPDHSQSQVWAGGAAFPTAGCWTKPVPCSITAQAEKVCGGGQRRAGAQLQHSGQMRSGSCTKWLLCGTLWLQASAWPSPTVWHRAASPGGHGPIAASHQRVGRDTSR